MIKIQGNIAQFLIQNAPIVQKSHPQQYELVFSAIVKQSNTSKNIKQTVCYWLIEKDVSNEKDRYRMLHTRGITLKSARSDAAWKSIKIILKNIYQKQRNRYQRQILLVKDEPKIYTLRRYTRFSYFLKVVLSRKFERSSVTCMQ